MARTGRSARELGRDMVKNRDAYVMMLPYMLVFFLFTLLPVLFAVGYSFTAFDILQPARFEGLGNYIRLFVDDTIFPTALRNTMVFAFVTGPLSYVLCFILAWFINDLPRFARSLATTVFYAPSITGQAYIVWMFIFSADSYGIANGLLMRSGLVSEPVNWLYDPQYNLIILMIVQLWLSLGAGFLAFIAGLKGVDASLYEAGVIDGIHNRFQEVWYITLPAIKPQLVFGMVMQLVGAFAVGDLSIRLCGFPSTEYSAETMVTHIMDYGTIRYEMGYACAMAALLFALMALSKWLMNRLINRVGS